MSRIKTIVIKILIIACILLAVSYGLFLTVLPSVLSSHAFRDSIDEILAKKTGIVLDSENLNVVTYPNLTVSISADRFNMNAYNNEILKVKNASLIFDIKRFKPQKINVDYIYLNQKHLKNFKNFKKSSNSTNKMVENLSSIPQLSISKIDILAEKNDFKNIFIDVENITIQNINNTLVCNFKAKINANFVKDTIFVSNNGYIYIQNNKLYASNLEILTGNSKLIIDGIISDRQKHPEFTIKGNDIPISDVAAMLLYFQKRNDNSKKFMENFYDYSGNLKVDLRITKDGVFGECSAENLAGKTVLFNVPILFKHVPFKFNGREFSGGAYGILGGEQVYSDFLVTNLATKEQESKGVVRSTLTNKSVGKYVPNVLLKGNANAFVDWHIKNKKINVSYNLEIPKDSDISYKNANLGLIDKNRNLFVQTYKFEDKLEITNYEYSANSDNEITKIITGNGMFTKQNGKLMPDYITCKTVTQAPVSIAGSFYKYLSGGVFSGDIKYDFRQNKITGNFNIKDSHYKDYKIDFANITTTAQTVDVEAAGEYKKSYFNTKITGLNNFNNKIQIYNLYLFLDELRVNAHKKSNKNPQFNESAIKNKTDNFDIDNYIIKLNKIRYKRAVINNILVKGSIKNNVFNFNTEKMEFAKGRLSAKGMYNFDTRKSDVEFSAKNIDSNIAADVLFNLPDHIQGNANAVLKVKTTDGIKQKSGCIHFSVKDGYLPKLGSTKFIIKQSKLMKKPFKFTLQDIVNINMKNMKALASDIEGSFDLNNSEINNVHITSSQKYLSLLMLGSYNMHNRNADLEMFGKYNNQEISKIKILFVPLSLIIKILFRPESTLEKYQPVLNAVPNITAEETDDISTFRVKIEGNISSRNNMKIEMKSIL